jgi:hypothetical protein
MDIQFSRDLVYRHPFSSHGASFLWVQRTLENSEWKRP